MPVPTTTLAAIHAQWAADPGIAAAALTLWNDEPPEGTTLGTYFAVEGFSEDEPILTTSGTKLFTATWDFVGYFVGDALAEATAATVRAAFNLKALTIAGRNNVQMVEVDYRVKLDRTRSTVTQRVAEARLSYRARTQGLT